MVLVFYFFYPWFLVFHQTLDVYTMEEVQLSLDVITLKVIFCLSITSLPFRAFLYIPQVNFDFLEVIVQLSGRSFGL